MITMPLSQGLVFSSFFKLMGFLSIFCSAKVSVWQSWHGFGIIVIRRDEKFRLNLKIKAL